MPSAAPHTPKPLHHVAITGVGPDCPGIVAGITAVLFNRNANIEDSTMTLLGNQFALIIIASLPDATPLDVLKAEFKPLEQSLGMRVFLQEVPPEAFQPSHGSHQKTPAMITVAGHDRTGITYHVSRLLAQYNVNITDLNAQIIPGEEGQVYIMLIETEVPAEVRQGDLEKALTQLGKELDMEIHFRVLDEISM